MVPDGFGSFIDRLCQHAEGFHIHRNIASIMLDNLLHICDALSELGVGRTAVPSTILA